MIARNTIVFLGCLAPALGACRRPGPPPLCGLKLECPRPLIDGDVKMLCKFQVDDAVEGTIYNQSAGVELRKNPGLGFPKPSYGVELRTASSADASENLLGMGSDGDWILDGLPNDRSLMRDALVADSFRQLGGARYAPEGRYCRLSLKDEPLGMYEPQGIYRLTEKIKRDDDRINMAADDGSGRSFIVRQDSAIPQVNDTRLRLSIGLEEIWQFVYPNMATPTQSVAVQSWLDGLSVALMSGNPGDPTSGIFASLDLEATVDWILIEELSKNIDAYNRGIHFVRDSGRPARIVPFRTDLSFGQPTVMDDMSTPRNDSPDGWITERPAFIQVVGGIVALKERLGPRWRVLRAGPWSTAAILGRLDGYGVTLTPTEIAQNFALWSLQPMPPKPPEPPDAGTDAASDDAGRPDAGTDAADERPGYSFQPVTDHADEVAKLRAFIETRLDWIDAHIDSYPN